MKKSLVALAALAATASFAQSTVTITGVMDAGYVASTQPGDYKANYIGQNGARTTAFKFIGNEDLGGGMSAIFQMEVDPSIIASGGNSSGLGGYQSNSSGLFGTTAGGATTASSYATRPSGLVGKGESFVGLNNAQYGKIRMGTVNSNTFETFAAVSQLGTGIGSGYAATGYALTGDITRYESSVRYDSPVINGFSAGVLKGTGNERVYGAYNGLVPTRATVVDYSVQYANGPLTVKYGTLASTSAMTSATASVTTTTKLLGAAYDAGVAKVSYGTGSVKSDALTTPVDAKLAVAAVSVPFMGSYRFIAQQGTLTYSNGPATVNVTDKNKVTGLALEKDLSKRTFVYLRNENSNLAAAQASSFYGAANNAALATTTAWGNVSPALKMTTVGVSHSF